MKTNGWQMKIAGGSGSVKPAIAALDLHVISVPKAKKKPKKKSK